MFVDAGCRANGSTGGIWSSMAGPGYDAVNM
jgi:hypothetical protein